MALSRIHRNALSSVGTLGIHAGIFALVTMLEPPPPASHRPVEVSVIPVPDEEPLEPDPEPSVTPTPVPTPPNPGGGRPRRAASRPLPEAGVASAAPATASDVALPEESAGPEEPEALGTGAGTRPAGGGVAIPEGLGPVPLADYSEVALPLAPTLLGKFAEREIVLDLFIDETGRVHHTSRLEGVDGRIDEAVADVSRQFRFVPATDGAGRATPGVVTYRFTVRALDPHRESRAVMSPLLASVGLRGASAASADLPEREEPAVAEPEPSPERRKLGRGLARGIAGTLFGGGEAVLAPSRSKSGLPRGRRVAELSRRDRERFCKWAVLVRGGEGYASVARFPEDREIEGAAGRQRWQDGAKSQDGSQTWTPGWYGDGSLNDESFMGRFESQERPFAYNPSKLDTPTGVEPLRSISPISGRRNGKMEGPERMAVVQSEATCVAELDEAAVCTVTVADVEACVDSMVLDPALGGESAACVKVSHCSAPIGK